MNLGKSQKIVLGLFTLLPFILFPFFFFRIFQFVMEMVSYGHREPEAADILMGVFSFIFPIIITGLLSLGLLVFYIVHALSNKKINSTEQVIWILIFIFVGIIGFPIYWFMRIWNDDQP